MTGYLLLTKGEASFARRGPLAITRAVHRGTYVSSGSLRPGRPSIAAPGIPSSRRGETHKQVASSRMSCSGCWPAAKTASGQLESSVESPPPPTCRGGDGTGEKEGEAWETRGIIRTEEPAASRLSAMEEAIVSRIRSHQQAASAGQVGSGRWLTDGGRSMISASNLRRDSNCSCFPPSDVDASAGPRHHSANQRPRDYNCYPAPLPSHP